MMVPTANTERYSFLLETNLGTGRPTFLAGATGSGKTMLAAQVCLNAQTLQIRSIHRKPVPLLLRDSVP